MFHVKHLAQKYSQASGKTLAARWQPGLVLFVKVLILQDNFKGLSRLPFLFKKCGWCAIVGQLDLPAGSPSARPVDELRSSR
jgi:hypothetical protein